MVVPHRLPQNIALYIFIQQIPVLNILNTVYTLCFFFPLQNAVCLIILMYLVPVLFTFYIQGVLKLKKNNSVAKRLIYVQIDDAEHYVAKSQTNYFWGSKDDLYYSSPIHAMWNERVIWMKNCIICTKSCRLLANFFLNFSTPCI